MKHIFSAVKDYCLQYNARFFHLTPQKTSAAYKLLALIAFCFIGHFTKAQEPVQASFSTFDYQGCVPVKIQFTDNSTGSPTSWYWDFGDGHTSTQANPSNTYTVPGSYIVKLVVKNAVSTDSASNEIIISGAKAEFDYTYTNICTTPATINFAVPNPLNKIIYRWDFGDSNKAIIPNPTNTYNSAGTYEVHLTTISPEGCEDSITKVIEIGNGTVDFNAPATVCVNEHVTFTDTSTPRPLSAIWLINNRVVQQGAGDFTFQFTRPGTYTIQLTENFGTCNNTATKPVQVLDKPTASFDLNGITKSCAYPDTTRFVNTSLNAVAFKWYFGDGDSSTEVNPVHVYGAGRFSPMLIAFNANGCTDTLVKTDAVFLGGAVINSINLPDSGCVPHPVTFKPDISSPEAIATYSWDFGDGSNIDASAQPTHTYNNTGRYDVALTITTVSGCTTTSIVGDAVSVGTHSIPDFTADKTTLCGADTVHFSGTASGPVSYWHWQFSNNAGAFTQDAKFVYADTGSRAVRLTISNSGCVDSVVKYGYIVINPPTASFRMQFDCNDRTKVGLIDRSIAPESWHWDFGDGTTSDQQVPPEHEYTANGRYYISLTTTNGACSDTYTDTVYISNTTPVFSFNPPDRHICRKADMELGVDNPTYILDYLWDLGDGHTLFSDTSIHYSYTKTGIYYPSLIARYHNGCQDTLYSPDSIVVTGPTASFATELSGTCLNDTTSFIDNSFSDGEHDIISRVWSYGDDITESRNDAPFTHLYTSSGSFKAMLAIADNNNCVDTARYNVIVNALPVVSAGLDTFACEGSSVQLQPSGALTYVWDRDRTLSCLSCTNPEAAPVQDNLYVVTGTDASSCHASDTVLVTVVHPFSMTVDEAPRDICQTKDVQLTASGADLYSWSPADGLNSATISNPVASPEVPTTYTVTGTDNKRCFSQTGSVIVNVHPNPEVTITNNDLVVEKGSQNVIITTGSSNILKWYWYPSIGLSCTDCPQPILDAQKAMTYNAVVYADFGCTDTAQLTVHVLCDQSKIYIPSAFTPNGDGKNDRFYVISSVDNPVRSFVIYNRAGEMLFNKRGNITNYSSEGWDGTYKGKPVPSGTYIYRIEVKCNDAVVPFTGTITLIR
ncbi:PKD domain-containing protein [Ilyomonas limi]|nr:PKD domain-containing protein [Ilyomonas limi]